MADDDKTTGVQTPRNHTQEEVHEAKQELRQAIHGSHEVLATANTVFPFTLVPHTVTVDREKLTITHRTFISVAEVMSLRVEDILNVTVNVGPLFGSLHILSRVMNNEKPYIVKYLWREDALRLKRVLQGYVIAIQKEIDCSPLKTEELAAMLDKLGKDDHT